MKLSFSTLGCPAWTWNTVLTQAKEMGFSGIEVRGIAGELAAEKIPEFSADRAQETRAQLQVYGLQLIGWGSSLSFHDPATFDAMVEKGLCDIACCARMGFSFLRVFGNNLIAGQERETVLRAIAGLKTLCAAGETQGVQILLEVHGQFNTLEILRPIGEAIISPAFGILWDVAHTDQGYGEHFDVFYQGIRPWLRHVHIKDHDRSGRLRMVGEGDIPLPAIIRMLQADGYPGYYSLEWEKKWHPTLEEPELAFPAYVRYMQQFA